MKLPVPSWPILLAGGAVVLCGGIALLGARVVDRAMRDMRDARVAALNAKIEVQREIVRLAAMAGNAVQHRPGEAHDTADRDALYEVGAHIRAAIANDELERAHLQREPDPWAWVLG